MRVKNDLSNVDCNSFTARPYQTELYEATKKGNTIISLGTGTGKTIIAVKLLKHMSSDIRGEWNEDGPYPKRSIFLCPTIPLVEQAESVIKVHMDEGISVRSFTSKNIQENWTKDYWIEKFRKTQILVMTAEVFRQILAYALFPLSRINLLVFDECHHAIKNDSYCEIMDFYKLLPESKPKILGLTISLIMQKEKCRTLKEMIEELSNRLDSSVRTIGDLKEMDKYSTNPVEVERSYDVQTSFTGDSFKSEEEKEVVMYVNEVQKQAENLITVIKFMIPQIESGKIDWSLKTSAEFVGKSLKLVLYSLTNLGLWAFCETCRIISKELGEKIATESVYPTSLLLAAKTIVDYGLDKFEKIINRISSPLERLLKFSTPRMCLLLEELKKANDLLCEYKSKSPAENGVRGNVDKVPRNSAHQPRKHLCAIIFVTRRIDAKIISLWLQALSKSSPDFNFLRVDYVTGSASESGVECGSKRQEEALIKFRKFELNVLIATSVLEEGLDIPRCNLVVRYDFPNTVREYIQSKGRARADEAKFVVFLPSNEAGYLITKSLLTQFREDEQEMKKYQSRDEDLKSTGEDSLPSDMTEKFKFVTPSGAVISLNSAIGLVNRYCLKLPSDSFTKLVPEVEIVEVCLEDAKSTGFQCFLRLPINCPLRQTIKSEIMRSKLLAKKAAAVVACKLLHKMKELDDNLLPVGKDNLKHILDSLGIEESQGGKDQPRAGTTKRRQYYNKLTAEVLTGPVPSSTKPCYLYVFAMKLTCKIPDEQNTRGRRIHDPAETTRSFGIIIQNLLPPTCDFPVFTRSGEVVVSVEPTKEKLFLTHEQLEKIHDFHYYTFHDVLHVDRYPMTFDINESDSNFLLAPVNFFKTYVDGKWRNLSDDSPDATIDWPFIERVREFHKRGEVIPTEAERQHFVFKREDFEDAVIKPWYRQNKVQFFFYVAEICDNLNPRSSFPDLEYPTFEVYYQQKYGIRVMNHDQPLLDVDHTSARLNLLTPRYVNRKGITLPMSTAKTKKEKRENTQLKQILIPELVVVHPFPASFWRKTVTLPCIIYRLNCLLLAEQLRVKISREINLSFHEEQDKWPPLDFGWTLAEVLAQQKENGDFESVEDSASTHDDLARNKTTSSLVAKDKTSSLTECENESTEDFLIDTFDPLTHSVPEVVDDEDDLEDENVLNQEFERVAASGALSGIFGMGHPLPGAPIGTWDRKASNTSRRQPKIVELNGDSSQNVEDEVMNGNEPPRVGSPSNFVNEIDWDQFDDDGQFFETGNVRGLSKISITPGINIEGLCQDLTRKTAEDDYDSDDSLNEDDEDEEFLMDNKQTTTVAGMGQSFPLSKHKNTPDPVNDILADGLLTRSGRVSPDQDLSANESETEFDAKVKEINELGEKLKPLVEFSVGKKDLNKDPDGPRTVIETEEEKTHFGELLPKHRREEIGEEGLSLKFDALKNEPVSSFGPSPAMILQALTMSNASDGINLERLETVGDSFLKYAVTLFFFCLHKDLHEGKLSYLRSRQISNLKLYELGRKKGLGNFIVASKFEPNDNWLPPGFFIPKGLEEALVKLRTEVKEKDKNSPDKDEFPFDVAQLKKLNLHNLSPEQLKEEVFKMKDQLLSSNLPSSVTTFSDVDEMHQIPYNLLTQQSIPDKSIADCVEALIGAYLLSSGTRGALLFMKWLGLKVMPEEEDPSINADPNDPIWHHLPPAPSPMGPLDPSSVEYAEKMKQLDRLYKGAGLDDFERNVLKYTFKDKSFLVQAFTHNSFSENRITDCYQRLEFLGDAILDFLVTRLLYEDPRKHSPGTLTDLRSALVNNTFFASLAVEYNFHKYLKNLSHDLMKVMTEFVKKFNAKFYREHCSLYIGEGETENLDDVEVPKALGDIFESVAGAIFLDSGMSLDSVWEVYYRMMKPEIEHFSNNVPKSPIRELLEMEPGNAQFGKPEIIPGKKFRVCVDFLSGEGKFYGVGRNKRIAKCTAAKRALRALRAKREKQQLS